MRVSFPILAALALASASRTALAQTPPTSLTGSYSPYEQESIKTALASLGGKIDPTPEGKIIEGIDVVPLEVIEARDPAPGILNSLHATTRPYVIVREVLLRPGDRYQKVLVDETARNLRRLVQLSLVVTTALAGSAPDRVRLVLVTKDVWSLRLGFNLAYSSGGLESLLVEPTETNIFGTHQTVLARLTMDPEAYSLGMSYRVPRLQGHWLTFAADANVLVNRRSGDPEGSFGAASVQRPLYSTRTEWAWFTGVGWRDEVFRLFSNAKLKTFDADVTPGNDRIPYEYRSRRITEQASITRSFGWRIKNDFTFGAEMNRRLYHTARDLSGFDPAAVREFVQTALPVSDTRVGPFAQWRGYTTNFLRILDFETLALQEDYRLGHDVWLRVYPVTSALGSSRTFLGAYAAAQYTVPIGDGLVRGSIESTTEAEAERLSDASVGANLRVVSPRLGFGRLVFDASVLNRYRNYLNRRSFLGGDTRLRGFPSSYFVGKDLIAMNLELRTRPVEILSLQLGLAAFYDMGSAFNGFDSLSASQLGKAVGLGLRALFPQLNRVVFRADLGFPIGSADLPGLTPVSFFATFEQAIPLQSVGGSTASGGTGTASSTGGALGQ